MTNSSENLRVINAVQQILSNYENFISAFVQNKIDLGVLSSASGDDLIRDPITGKAVLVIMFQEPLPDLPQGTTIL